ncbi:MAG: DUF3135 domain-containing protein [Pseudomonadales bacterium]|nr:DUF3135 domain-containing protein [Pseudomonadales bacterium]
MTVRLPAFDVLVDMARNDPQGLETLRRSLTNAVITAAPTEDARRKLRGLAFRIDMERRRASSPLAATVRLSALMSESLARLRQSMVDPDALRADDRADDGQLADVVCLGRAGSARIRPAKTVWPPGSADL